MITIFTVNDLSEATKMDDSVCFMDGDLKSGRLEDLERAELAVFIRFGDVKVIKDRFNVTNGAGQLSLNDFAKQISGGYL